MEPSDPKRLSDEEAEIIGLLGDATMGSVKEAKKAIAELLRRGKDIKAGFEVAERLIEILDPPRGRPNRETARTLYATRESPINKTHARMFVRFEELYGSSEFKKKAKVYEALHDEFGYQVEYCKEIITDLMKRVENDQMLRGKLIHISSPPD